MVNARNLQEVREFFQAHKHEIILRYGAEGAGIGKQSPKDDSYVIVVYLGSRNAIPKETVILEGIPLKFEVTGRFKPQS